MLMQYLCVMQEQKLIWCRNEIQGQIDDDRLEMIPSF